MQFSKILKLAKSRTWHRQDINAHPLCLIAAGSGSAWLLGKGFEKSYSHFFYVFSRGRAFLYYDQEDLKKISDAVYTKPAPLILLSSLKKSHLMEYQTKATRYEKSVRKRHLSQITFAKFVKMFQQARDLMEVGVGNGHLCEAMSFSSERRLERILKAKNAFDTRNFAILSAPSKPSFIQAANELLWNVRKSRGRMRNRLIAKFQRLYPWIENSYLGPKKMTRGEVLRRVETQKKPLNLAYFKKAIRMKQALMQKLGFGTEEMLVTSIIEFCAHWQDERKTRILESIGRLETMIAEAARRAQISTTEMKYLTPREITKKNLQSRKFIRLLKHRYQQAAYYTLPQKDFVFTGNKFKVLSRALERSIDKSVMQLSGMVASPGEAKGRVRICTSLESIKLFKKGEILVAGMTRPEYLPAMQKAAAFVTDEGGITSHAAIISREMAKPCIIGTKVATQVFKDGDLIEVDANHGWVRKIH